MSSTMVRPFRIPELNVGENNVGAASGGLWSCTSDLVKLYSSFLRSFNHEAATGEATTPGSPLRQIARSMSAHVPMVGKDQSYGLGWVRVQLPNTLGHIGLNGRLLTPERGDSKPDVGRGVGSQRVIYHQGTLPGALACVLLLPDTDSFIVVLRNALALTDVPDWVVQMALEELLEVPTAERVDLMAYARKSIEINLEWHLCVKKGFVDGRPARIQPVRSLEDYVGTYVDRSGVFRNVVSLDGSGGLSWAFQSLASERFTLTHYDGNTFTWLQSRNELSRRGRWVLGDDRDPDFCKAVFCVDGDGTATSLLWRYNPELPPIEYYRVIS